ncbi:inner membrane protein [Actinobacillus equuli]|nr:inner membrane protein [Actinobacillus equuli]
MEQRSHIIPLFLAIVITAIAIWSGIAPSDRAVWYAEVMPILLYSGY